MLSSLGHVSSTQGCSVPAEDEQPLRASPSRWPCRAGWRAPAKLLPPELPRAGPRPTPSPGVEQAGACSSLPGQWRVASSTEQGCTCVHFLWTSMVSTRHRQEKGQEVQEEVKRAGERLWGTVGTEGLGWEQSRGAPLCPSPGTCQQTMELSHQVDKVGDGECACVCSRNNTQHSCGGRSSMGMRGNFWYPSG